jgi:hypothetical protein
MQSCISSGMLHLSTGALSPNAQVCGYASANHCRWNRLLGPNEPSPAPLHERPQPQLG